MVSTCVMSPKVSKASNRLLWYGITDVFAKNVVNVNEHLKGFKEISCSDYITLLAFTNLGDVTRV
jgi:hypothetical protein